MTDFVDQDKHPDPPPAASRRALVADVTVRLLEQFILRAHSDDMLPPERELTTTLKVGRWTLRRALGRLHNDGWLIPIHGHGHKITRPAQEAFNTIGVFSMTSPALRMEMPFCRALFRGIEETAAADRRHVLTFSNFQPALQADRSVFWPSAVRLVEAIVTFDLYDVDVITHMAELVPTVCMDVECRRPGLSSVCFDHPISVRMAVKYLHDMGHRRVGLAARTRGSDPALRARADGFRSATRWLDCPDAERWIYHMAMQQNTEHALEPFLRAPVEDRPTALVVVDHVWPVAAVLLAAGIRVPDDVSLIHVGHMEMCSDWLHRRYAARYPVDQGDPAAGIDPFFCDPPPALARLKPTTIHLPAAEMGEWAVRELARRRSSPNAQAEHCILAPRMHMGNSVVAPHARPGGSAHMHL